MKNQEINAGGVNGTGEGVVNVNSESFKALRKAVEEHAKTIPEKDKIRYRLISVRLQMETYLREEISEQKSVGDFLKQCISALGVKNKEFADFIEIKESNLSSIIKGKRRVPPELAFTLGSLLNVPPNLWLGVQSKNELLKVEATEPKKFDKFKLETFFEKIGRLKNSYDSPNQLGVVNEPEES